MDEDMKWFAMGAPYRNEIKVQTALQERAIECFVPMITHVVDVRGHKRKKTEPAVSNLLFVHTTEARLREVKPQIPRLQYKVLVENGLTRKVIIRDEEMTNFINFITASSATAQLKFSRPGELDLKKGTRVRLIGGGLDGITGTLIRTANKRSHSFVVELDGLISAQVEMSNDMVEVIS